MRRAAARLVLCFAALGATGCGPTAITSEPDADTATSAPDGGGPTCREPPGAVVGHHVRVLYLVPSDRQASPARVQNLASAVRHVQHWFNTQNPDGATYLTHDPAVEVVDLDNEAAYYATNENGANESFWFFNNVADDAIAATTAEFNDPVTRWVLAIEAESACNQVGRRTSRGMVLLSSPDLDVLAGAPRADPCGEPPAMEPRCPQVGQVAYHLGRALGLRPPPGCADADGSTPCKEGSLMQSGADAYPNAVLADSNLEKLADNPYFRPLNPCPLACDQPVGGPEVATSPDR